MTGEPRPADETLDPPAAAPAAGSGDVDRAADAERTEQMDADPEARIAALEADLAALRERLARAVADYQNLQRRSEEARAELSRRLVASLVGPYLPLLDDLRLALGAADADPELAGRPWLEGVRLVERKFVAVLEQQGVRELAAEGAPFDPALHEAVGHAPGADGQVVLELQRGFSIDGAVVRPARVLVGDGSGPAAAPPAGD